MLYLFWPCVIIFLPFEVSAPRTSTVQLRQLFSLQNSRTFHANAEKKTSRNIADTLAEMASGPLSLFAQLRRSTDWTPKSANGFRASARNRSDNYSHSLSHLRHNSCSRYV